MDCADTCSPAWMSPFRFWRLKAPRWTGLDLGALRHPETKLMFEQHESVEFVVSFRTIECSPAAARGLILCGRRCVTAIMVGMQL